MADASSPKPSLGQRLRQAREARGWSASALAQQANIKLAYLEALEQDDFQALPERPLVRGYLRSLEALLDLELLADFGPTAPNPQADGLHTPADFPWWIVPQILSLLVILSGVGWWIFAAIQTGKPVVIRHQTNTEDPVVVVPSVRLTIKTKPVGAQVYVDNGALGVSPIIGFPVTQREQAVLRIQLDGYDTIFKKIPLNRSQFVQVEMKAHTAPIPKVSVLLLEPEPEAPPVRYRPTPLAPY